MGRKQGVNMGTIIEINWIAMLQFIGMLVVALGIILMIMIAVVKQIKKQ